MSEERWNGPGESHPAEVISPVGAGGGAEDRRRRAGAEPPAPTPATALPRPPLSGGGPRTGPARTRLPATETQFTPQQRLLGPDALRRGGLPAGAFAPLGGGSKHTLDAGQMEVEAAGRD